ncbi:unnamed protein product [Prorocentrum cordatum]|uniref:Uncharacterized protein n=1 Tax=Prorocentrum cordatum TaxID=2364126 RepID=A0ABN9Y187_9DINO|nr:unnamed protein product [Polarella glacialis]
MHQSCELKGLGGGARGEGVRLQPAATPPTFATVSGARLSATKYPAGIGKQQRILQLHRQPPDAVEDGQKLAKSLGSHLKQNSLMLNTRACLLSSEAKEAPLV